MKKNYLLSKKEERGISCDYTIYVYIHGLCHIQIDNGTQKFINLKIEYLSHRKIIVPACEVSESKRALHGYVCLEEFMKWA